jgi:uncharacterized protein (DUF58 family)
VDVQRTPSLFLVSVSLCVISIFLFLALLYGQRDLTIACLLVLSLATGVRLWSRSVISRIECTASIDRHRLFPGNNVTIEVDVANNGFLPCSFTIEVPTTGLLHSEGERGNVTGQGSLLWYQKARFRWELMASRRGVYPVGPIGVSGGDLFAFSNRGREVQTVQEVIVYPNLVPLAPFSSPKREFFGMPGAESPVKDPVYILGTTDYQPGRPARFIQWKASARHHRLQEKVFEPTEQEKILLMIEVGQFADQGAEGEFEETIETVASMAVQEEQKGYALGFVTNGALTGGGSPVIPVARNPQQLTAILETLARLRMERQGNLPHILRRWSGLSWGTTVICFTLEEGEEVAKVGQYVRRRNLPFVPVLTRDSRHPVQDGIGRLDAVRYLENLRIGGIKGR